MSQPNHEQPDLLQSFLASNEARCPVCSYDLRGATSGACPECGHRPRLGLAQPDVLGRRRGLLLLVFAWLLLAGAMNAYSGARSIHTRLTSRQLVSFIQRQPTLAIDLGGLDDALTFLTVEAEEAEASAPEPTGDEAASAGVPTAEPVAPVPAPTDPADPGDPGATVALEHTASFRFGTGSEAVDAAGGGTATGPLSITFGTGGALNIVPTSTSSTLSWSSVSWRQWTGIAWWIVLTMVATVALTVLFRYRRREASRRVGMLLMTTAWLAFGGYFAYHVVHFAGRLM